MTQPNDKDEERTQTPVHPIYWWMANRIEPFRQASGPPPQTLWPFLGWALEGTGREIKIAVFASICVGIATVTGMFLIGWLIDEAQATGPGFLAAEWWKYAVVAGFYLTIWPLAMVINAAFNSVALGPNVFALTLSRLNRYTLGQSLSYFDNDFAGRIAQKKQQTARAMMEVVNETTNIAGNAAATAIGAAVMLGFTDWRLASVVLLWIAAFVFLIRWYVPKIRVRSQHR
ncbi:MAG: ABC transporter ATP-binding protein, partial [Pseudomonadota bacterium]